MTKLKDLKDRLMGNPGLREEHARIDDGYPLVEVPVRARMAAKPTRAELARRPGMTRSVVARLDGGRGLRSLAILRRYAEATGTRLIVEFVQPGRRDVRRFGLAGADIALRIGNGDGRVPAH